MPGKAPSLNRQGTIQWAFCQTTAAVDRAGIDVDDRFRGRGKREDLEVIAAVVIVLFIFFVFTKTWTVLVVIIFILMLISFLISSVLAIRARQAATRSTYEREVKPDIERFNAYHGLSDAEFKARAAEILPEDSPVLKYSSEKNT